MMERISLPTVDGLTTIFRCASPKTFYTSKSHLIGSEFVEAWSEGA